MRQMNDVAMKSIITTYPDFPSLPKGLKRMLLASEDLFFGEAKGLPPVHKVANRIPLGMSRPGIGGRMDSRVQPWKN